MTDTSPFTSPLKVKLVISDFHLSMGKWLPNGVRNPLEDFLQDEKFAEFLDHYSTGKYESTDVELIINGDFFDPLAVLPVKGMDYPLEVEEPAAVQQFKAIVEAHPTSMSALKRFLNRDKKIIFRWGNHDAAVLWPAVQTYLRDFFSPVRPELLEFQTQPYIFDRICIDHGHQYETINHFDEKNIFIERRGRTILNLPFGSFFVMGFLNRIKLSRTYINQVQPLRLYVRISFFLQPLWFTLNGFRVAWFFIKMRLITHPMRFARFRKTVLLLKEIFFRPSLEHEAEKILNQEGCPFDTIIMGHNHLANYRLFKNGKIYVNTGTWIPITGLEMTTLGRHMLRTYAMIEYEGGKPRTSLKVWNGTPRISEDFL